MFYAASNGFLDALIRGNYNSSLIANPNDFVALLSCSTVEDLRIQLTAIYPELSTTLNKDSKVTAHKVFDAAIEHLQQQFEYFYQNGQTEIQKLLDAFRMPFIIDNTCLLLTACASGTIFREVSWSDTLSEDCVTGDGSKRLLAKCHKMGLFPTMGVLATPGHVLSELVADVLYESPIGPLLERIPNAEVRLKQSLSDVQHIDHMSNCLYREHLDDLANLILSLHADNECKAKLLHYVQLESDQRLLNVAINSLASTLNVDERLLSFPKTSSFNEEALVLMAQATSAVEVLHVYRSNAPFAYANALEDVSPENEDVAGSVHDFLERTDRFFAQQQTDCLSAIFEDQFSVGIFFAFFKLKEQEARNMLWLTDCISNHRDKAMLWKHFVLPTRY